MAELEELHELLNNEPWNWENHLSDREMKEIQLALHYAKRLNHGTAGHNRLILIAKLATMLNIVTTRNPEDTIMIEVNSILTRSFQRLQKYVEEMTANTETAA